MRNREIASGESRASDTGAKEMLRTTDYSVVEIARRVGYDNANYFSAVFHRMTGLPPIAFKEGGIPL